MLAFIGSLIFAPRNIQHSPPASLMQQARVLTEPRLLLVFASVVGTCYGVLVGGQQPLATCRVFRCTSSSRPSDSRLSLAKLRTDQVDLTLIHWPSPGGGVPVAEYMGALADAKVRGLTRRIGISNFPIALMREAIAAVGANEIATNQIELHPYLQNRKVVEFAQSQGIHITSYMTLGYGKVLSDPVIQEIAEQHGATPAQVALAWAMQQGYAVIPSSTKRGNLQANLDAQRLQLTAVDMSRIATLDRGERLVDPAGLAPAWD